MMLGTFNLVPVMRKGSANKSTPSRSAVWKWRGSQNPESMSGKGVNTRLESDGPGV